MPPKTFRGATPLDPKVRHHPKNRNRKTTNSHFLKQVLGLEFVKFPESVEGLR